MRSDKRRTDRYRKKIRGLVLPGQKARFSGAVQAQVKVEQAVKAILAKNGVSPIFNHYYMEFGKKVVQLAQKHGGQIACNEANAEQQKWVSRGLSFNILEDIKNLYITCAGVPPGVPFRFDISLLDGTDVLV